MRKLKLYIACSFDHFIARANGDVSWLELPEYAIKGEDYGYADFYDSIDTTIMGNTTYKIIKGFDIPFPYKDKKNYVFSIQMHQHWIFLWFPFIFKTWSSSPRVSRAPSRTGSSP
jgi:dihydrofolate reductase